MKTIEATHGTDRRTVSLLHLEDNVMDRELIARVLEQSGLSCTLSYASTRIEFQSHLEAAKPDLILSDFTLPGYDGMTALADARKSQPQVPFLFISGTIGEQRAVAGLRAGATDYVLKDNLDRLGPAIWRALREADELRHSGKLEEQLLHARKLEAIGQLASGVAHDFNNLLTIIQGNAELALLTMGSREPGCAEFLKRIIGASGRAANLTSQLLTFGRKRTACPQTLRLNGVVKNLVAMLDRLIGGGIQLECHYAETNPVVHADLCMIETTIINLVVNARDALPQGGRVAITTNLCELTDEQVRLHPGAGAGKFASIRVSDTGAGMAPEVIERIFEPFFTTKEVGKGTGLGLATVYGIITEHQGWIEVESRVGVGTAFEMFLPSFQDETEPGLEPLTPPDETQRLISARGNGS